MISDICSQRYVLFVSAVLAENLHVTNYLTPEEMKLVLNWGDTLLQGHDSERYQLVYKWEALCISVLISRDPHPLGEFQKDLVSNAANNSPEDERSLRDDIQIILSLYNSSLPSAKSKLPTYLKGQN